MSQAHHGEPLRWHWLYIPLVAYLVFAVGPSVLAPIFFILSLFVDISSIIGPAQHAPGIGSILPRRQPLPRKRVRSLALFGLADPSDERRLSGGKAEVTLTSPNRRDCRYESLGWTCSGASSARPGDVNSAGWNHSA